MFLPKNKILGCLVLPLMTVHFCTAQSLQGDYIITWDNKLIQGKVQEIYYADWRTDMTFKNEYGRTYNFSPARVGGFLQIVEQDTVMYESKYAKNRWLFLKRVVKEEQLSLYYSPNRKWTMVRGVNGMEKVYMPVNEVWLEFRKKKPFRIYPLTYKKELKRRFSKYPDFAEKIGSPGYKFRDIEKIVAEYNTLYYLNQRRI